MSDLESALIVANSSIWTLNCFLILLVLVFSVTRFLGKRFGSKLKRRRILYKDVLVEEGSMEVSESPTHHADTEERGKPESPEPVKSTSSSSESEKQDKILSNTTDKIFPPSSGDDVRQNENRELKRINTSDVVADVQHVYKPASDAKKASPVGHVSTEENTGLDIDEDNTATEKESLSVILSEISATNLNVNVESSKEQISVITVKERDCSKSEFHQPVCDSGAVYLTVSDENDPDYDESTADTDLLEEIQDALVRPLPVQGISIEAKDFHVEELATPQVSHQTHPAANPTMSSTEMSATNGNSSVHKESKSIVVEQTISVQPPPKPTKPPRSKVYLKSNKNDLKNISKSKDQIHVLPTKPSPLVLRKAKSVCTETEEDKNEATESLLNIKGNTASSKAPPPLPSSLPRGRRPKKTPRSCSPEQNNKPETSTHSNTTVSRLAAVPEALREESEDVQRSFDVKAGSGQQHSPGLKQKPKRKLLKSPPSPTTPPPPIPVRYQKTVPDGFENAACAPLPSPTPSPNPAARKLAKPSHPPPKPPPKQVLHYASTDINKSLSFSNTESVSLNLPTTHRSPVLPETLPDAVIANKKKLVRQDAFKSEAEDQDPRAARRCFKKLDFDSIKEESSTDQENFTNEDKLTTVDTVSSIQQNPTHDDLPRRGEHDVQYITALESDCE